MKKQILFILLFPALISGKTQTPSFGDFLISFKTEYNSLQIPAFTFDYREYFASVPSIESLEKQTEFFIKARELLAGFQEIKLNETDRVKYMQLNYEVTFNLERIELEKQWVLGGRIVPNGGLYELANFKEWYAYFVKKYTSLSTTSEEIMEFGKNEVGRVKEEIRKIRMALGITDSLSFYTHLKDSSFYITDKQSLLKAFRVVDSTVRYHIEGFTGYAGVPPVFPMEWPDADPNTPPGMYLNNVDNAYGKDVFWINFYGKKFNRRTLEWLYMHEAIPGHHLQFTYNKIHNELDDLFTYPGNFEGWACYVEYYGKQLGLYEDLYSYLGKWEWDLVRSARLVIDAGIHSYGWTREQAMKYWKNNIPGQDDIADREITRVMNWPGQALSYKIGAAYIFYLKEKWLKQNSDQPVSKFHSAYLESGRLPLPVINELLLIQSNSAAPELIYEEAGKESAYPRLSKDGNEVLLQSNRTGKWQLYIYEILNKKLLSITNDTFNNNFPEWSQDNKWIAFVSDRDGNEEIYMANTDGSNLQRITNDNARDIHPYFSPDGKFILFNSTRGNGSFDIYRYTISNGKTEQLTNTKENETCARYSPDMGQIVFLKNDISTDDIFTLDLATGLTENISKTPGTLDGWPMFSQDGQWIYFSSMETGTYCIWKRRTDGTEIEQLTFADEGEEDARVNVSFDGKYFIYNKRYGSTISILKLDNK